jgi:hypothetical protein
MGSAQLLAVHSGHYPLIGATSHQSRCFISPSCLTPKFYSRILLPSFVDPQASFKNVTLLGSSYCSSL